MGQDDTVEPAAPGTEGEATAEEGAEVGASDACGATAPLVEESTDPHPCAPGEDNAVHLAYDTPEEMRGWPRRIRARRNEHRRPGEHAVELYLYYPTNPADTRQIHFTSAMFQSWLDARGETRNSAAVATWGTKTTVEFQLSKIVDGELVFDTAAADARHSLDVYNLDSSQPKWRRFLQRSLAILPIAHVQAANLKSIFLDFKVGTNRIGPRAPVGDGGTNWRVRIGADGARTATTNIDADGCSTVCATFAALNRTWGERDVADAALPDEAGIDAAFDDPAAILFTPYHELGHLLDYGGATRGAALAAGRLSASLRNDLWDRYRQAIAYDGESDGPGEGFAEAYRQRFQGQSFAARRSTLAADVTERTIREMNEAFHSLGIPSAESVRDAWAVIRATYGGG